MASTSKQAAIFGVEDWKRIYQSFNEVDFLSYDYESLRKAFIDYLTVYYPETYNDYVESSEFIALLDVISFMGQSLAFRNDLNTRENFIDTAERRDSVVKLANLVSYTPKRNLAAQGYLKFTSVTTTESIVDINGLNLSNTPIIWNDPANPNWQEQFNTVINAALVNSQKVGKPGNSQNLLGIQTSEYALNISGGGLPIFPFAGVIDNLNMNFEIVSVTSLNKDYIYEIPPVPGRMLNMVYRNDKLGYASPNTGFFFYFKQGTLLNYDFALAQKINNQVVDINIQGINNNDTWLFQLNSTGTAILNWTQVNNVYTNNLSRTAFAVTSRFNDQVSYIFGDGIFADIPIGPYRAYVRSSNGLEYTIDPQELQGTTINIPYISRTGRNETLTVTLALTQPVSNAQNRESITQIKERAPARYYTQNRMVNGEDYSTFPFTLYSSIIKSTALNRSSIGASRYLDLLDPTGKYSSTNNFADDGALWQNNTDGTLLITPSSNSDITEFITNTLKNALARADAVQYYTSNYPRYTGAYSGTSYDGLVYWKQLTVNTNNTTGYFYIRSTVAHDTPIPLGTYTTSNMKYVTNGALLKFVPPQGYVFDKDNRLKLGTATLPTDQLYIWVSPTAILGDGYNNGAGALATGVGPVSLNNFVPTGAILDDSTGQRVVSVTVTNQGSGYLSRPPVSIVPSVTSDPGTGATADSYLTASSIILNSGGTGYRSGDIITLATGTGTSATVRVKTVAAGVITEIIYLTGGSYSTPPSGNFDGVYITDVTSTASGTGVDATFNVVMSLGTIDVTNGGTNYSNQVGHTPVVQLSTTHTLAKAATAGDNFIFLDSLTQVYDNNRISGTGIPTNTLIIDIDYVNLIVYLNQNLSTNIPVDTIVTIDAVNPATDSVTATAVCIIEPESHNYAILPAFSNTFPAAVIQGMITRITQNLSFTLIFDNSLTIDKVRWSIGAADATNYFVKFVSQGSDRYTVSYRSLKYFFGSVSENRFTFSTGNKVYDPQSGTLIQDFVKILRTNNQPFSNQGFTSDIKVNIIGQQIESDGYPDDYAVEVTSTDMDSDGVFDNPDFFSEVTGYSPYSNNIGIYTFFQTLQDANMLTVTQLIPEGGIIYTYATLDQIELVKYEYASGTVFYAYGTNTFYISEQSTTTAAYTLTLSERTDYAVETGRSGLNFQYRHNSPDTTRIDPATTNIIDLYIVTQSYYTQYQNWINDSTGTIPEPFPPTTNELNQDYGKLDEFKMISDSVVPNSVKFKPLFGQKAAYALQATIKVIKNPGITASDSEIRSAVTTALNSYFSIDSWDFGDTFYFSDLSGYLHQALGGLISSAVLVPNDPAAPFGTLYEIRSAPNEIFVNAAQATDILVIAALTPGQLQIQ